MFHQIYARLIPLNFLPRSEIPCRMLRERIISVTATIINDMPRASDEVKGSLKTNTPIHTAVSGSIAPKTEVSVPPIRRTASTRVILEITVGNTARRKRFNTDIPSGMGWIPKCVDARRPKRMVLTTKT